MSANKTILHRASLAALAIGFLISQQTASAATLMHRYNFTDDGAGANIVDLVGGAQWYGTLPNGGDLATITNQLILDSTLLQHVQFPPGILSNYTAVTIDMWTTIGGGWWFVWSFGNTDPVTGFGGNALWLTAPDARATIASATPSWGTEQNVFIPSLLNAGSIRVTVVCDPPNGRMLVYTNGILAGVNYSITATLANVWSINNYISRSPYAGDGYLSQTVDEFRIFNGALSGPEIAAYHLSGPDSAVPSDLGALTSLAVTAPQNTLPLGGRVRASVTGNFALFPNGPVYIDRHLCAWWSSDTSVATVDAMGIVTAGSRVGTATISASYGGITNSMVITTLAEPVTLLHRYSFSNADDGMGNWGAVIADSVGGADWNGTLPVGGAFADGQLFLSGGAGQHVGFPTNYFANRTNITFEVWTTFPPNLPWNAWFFGFGNTVGDAGGNYFFVQPQSGTFVMAGIHPGWMGETRVSANANWSGQTMHIVCVASTSGGYLALYTNGVLAGINRGLTYRMTSIINNFSWINRSLYPADPFVDNTINEFRIHNGAMSSDQVAASFAAGPDSLPAPAPPVLQAAFVGGNVVLTWPAGPWKLQTQTSTLAAGLSTGWVDVVGATSPHTNIVDTAKPAVFYRLSN